MHALIIEDEPLIALLIEDHLRTCGYNSFDFAVTEAEAIGAAHRRCPDLITSDISLAEGCGIAAVETICGNYEVPVVYITASMWELRARAPQAAVVGKPFTGADLRAALTTSGIVRAGYVVD